MPVLRECLQKPRICLPSVDKKEDQPLRDRHKEVASLLEKSSDISAKSTFECKTCEDVMDEEHSDEPLNLCVREMNRNMC